MRLEFIFDLEDMSRKVQAETKRLIREKFADERGTLEEAIKDRFAEKVMDTPTYKALEGEDTLLYELGIPDIQEALRNIINTLVDKVQVKLRRVRLDDSQYIVPVEFIIVDDNLNGILDSESASYYDFHSRAGVSYQIPWLEWLLFSRGQPVVIGYDVFFGSFEASRTGGAIMAKVNGADYRVDPSYAGTEDSNFIVDTAKKMGPEIEDIVNDLIISEL